MYLAIGIHAILWGQMLAKGRRLHSITSLDIEGVQDTDSGRCVRHVAKLFGVRWEIKNSRALSELQDIFSGTHGAGC